MFGLSIHHHRDDFEQRCAPYAGMVYRHCLHMLKNVQEAEDAAQESMLRAFRAYPSFRGKGVASWLYAIAHNTCLDVLKSARYRRVQLTLDDPENPFEQADDAPTPEAAYVQKAEKEQLWELVMQLSQEQQTILSLYYGEQMTYEQIAQATGTRVGTVKSRLNRAKEALARKLEEKG
ncbi:MAG: RNA polymerase sigma factor [Clostridia bacterium]|nr:RNA polymerase sigma factor [Clostridia bacterium]